MSTINTSGVNVNYPIPGVNNNSQGFRDNFASIKTNLNAAGTEITDLQNKVIVKSALANSTINNDMANTLMSNTLTRGFRASTYNLGNALSGTVLVDASLGDVQYGTVAGNVTLQFAGWAPAGTQSNVELQLAISNANAVVSFPSSISSNACFGVTTLENYANIASISTVSIPYGVCQLDYRLSTVDCGGNVTIEPYNRPRKATTIRSRDPAPTGQQGDVSGTVTTSNEIEPLPITGTNAADYFITTGNAQAQLYTDMPMVFTGTSFEANITSGTTYYVRNVVSSTTFTVSSTVGGANVNLATGTGTMFANPVSYLYVCTDAYDASVYLKSVTATNTSGNVTLSDTTNLVTNAPVIFAGTTFGGIVVDTTYYIKTIGTGGNVIISQSRTNGVAGTALALTTLTGTCTANIYVGSDIWKRIALTSW